MRQLISPSILRVRWDENIKKYCCERTTTYGLPTEWPHPIFELEMIRPGNPQSQVQARLRSIQGANEDTRQCRLLVHTARGSESRLTKRILLACYAIDANPLPSITLQPNFVFWASRGTQPQLQGGLPISGGSKSRYFSLCG